MIKAKAVVMAALIGTVGITQARAECEIADAKLEEAIQQNPKLRGPANRQSVRDLRSCGMPHSRSDPMGVMKTVSASLQISAN